MIKSKKLSARALYAVMALALVAGLTLVPAMPVSAAISGGSVTGHTADDLVVEATDVDYDVSFDTDIAATAVSLWLIFPSEYTITDGDLGT